MRELFLKFWRFFMKLFTRGLDHMIPEKINDTPLYPQDSSAKFQRLQEMLAAGMSYRAIARATGVKKKDLKEIQIRNTGRFFFGPSKTIKGNQALWAERYDPISNSVSSPPGGPVFSSAANAWSWLEGQRVLAGVRDQYEWSTSKHTLPDGRVIDLTPTSH